MVERASGTDTKAHFLAWKKKKRNKLLALELFRIWIISK